jgi:ABC-type iron transport system FetAB permease component
MSATAIAISACLSSFRLRRDIVETRLSYGASRWEAARSIAIESVRVAMLPTINGMSIIGLISIPGMMTGQIMAGSSVFQAAMYQQIMMFMISACSAFSVLYCVAVSVFV